MPPASTASGTVRGRLGVDPDGHRSPLDGHAGGMTTSTLDPASPAGPARTTRPGHVARGPPRTGAPRIRPPSTTPATAPARKTTTQRPPPATGDGPPPAPGAARTAPALRPRHRRLGRRPRHARRRQPLRWPRWARRGLAAAHDQGALSVAAGVLLVLSVGEHSRGSRADSARACATSPLARADSDAGAAGRVRGRRDGCRLARTAHRPARRQAAGGAVLGRRRAHRRGPRDRARRP